MIANCFYALTDEEGRYVDHECIYKDRDNQYCCSTYMDYKNKVLLASTYEVAQRMLEQFNKLCESAKIHKEVKIININC